MTSYLKGLEIWLNWLRQKRTLASPSVQEKLERLATGAFLTAIRLHCQERRLNYSPGDYSAATAREYRRWRRVEFWNRYGALDRGGLRSATEALHAKGLSVRDIRLLVANRILSDNGILRLSKTEKTIHRLVGALLSLFFVLALTVYLTGIWTRPINIPADIFLNILFSISFLGLFAAAGFIMSCCFFRPYSITTKLMGMGTCLRRP